MKTRINVDITPAGTVYRGTRHAMFLLTLMTVLNAFIAQGQQRLSLEDAVAMATTNNPELKTTAMDIARATQQRTIARSLLLPSVTATGQVNHYFELQPFFGFGEGASGGKVPYGRFGGEDQLTAAIAAVQPLYNPQAYPAVQRARLKERESQLLFDARKISVVSQVKQTYLQVLVVRERIRVQQESIDRNRIALQDARSLFLQGKGLRVDTLRAFTLVKNLEPGLLKLRYAEETAKLQLATLLGLDSLAQLELTDSLFMPDEETMPTEEEVYETAKSNNPEYRVINLQQQIAGQQEKVAAGARLPTIAAVGAYQVNSQARNFDYGNAYFPNSSFVGLQVAVPLFTGLGNQARIKQAAIERSQSEINATYAYEQLRAITHQAVADSRESLARLQTTATVSETAKLSYSIVEYRYKKGVSSRLELTDAELALSTAQSNYLEAVYDYLSARIALLKLMGQVN